jgi:phosphonopyruvate decarboxylase
VIDAAALLAGLTGLGVTVVAGVPCSYLTPLINRAIGDPAVRYLSVTQEGEAASVAAGAWLGGGLGCAISQNSGLGNMVNPLTSLLLPARIPAIALVTWRGRPGERDEPQHELMGRITAGLLSLIEVEADLVPADPALLPGALERCRGSLARRSLPWAFILPKGTLVEEPLMETAPDARAATMRRYGTAGARPARAAALERILAELPDSAAVVSTTGHTSRELYTLADRPQHFYLVGAMGSAATVGLGVALHTPRPVVVLDGDGAALMRLGSLATVAAHGPAGLTHVVLDNGAHDSTGGQRTLSASADLVAVAAACGYAQVHACGEVDDLAVALRRSLASPGPSFIHLPIRPGSMSGLGRPRVTPVEVARRFRAFAAAPHDQAPSPSPPPPAAAADPLRG